MKHNLLTTVIAFFFTLVAKPTSAQAQFAVAQDNMSTGQVSKTAYDSLRNIFRKMNAGLLNDTVLLKFEYDVVPAGRALPAENAEIIQQKITEELRMLHGALTVRKKISVLEMVSPGPRADELNIYNNMANVDSNNLIRELLSRQGITGNSIMLLPGGKFISLNSSDGWAALHLPQASLRHLLSNTSEGLARK